MLQNHEIDYKIYGEELQFVEIELDPNETAVAESGAFMMMDNGIEMQTIFGDGSQQQDNSLAGTTQRMYLWRDRGDFTAGTVYRIATFKGIKKRWPYQWHC